MKYNIIIKPYSRQGPLVERVSNDELIVHVRELAVEGKANEALVKLLAEYFSVSKTHVRLVRGAKSRQKIVEISAEFEKVHEG